jgi:ankyrin repeat protein
MTPLLYAARYGHMAVVEALMAMGADMEAKEDIVRSRPETKQSQTEAQRCSAAEQKWAGKRGRGEGTQ